ncbi:MAG: DNA topoisomerase 3 [Bacteroidales bacterium]|nr:DNA topoisomerase 3 [Bacteroidales bacterium]
MKVCIAEKHSVAKDIATLLGATSRHDGYYEGNGYQVTWTIGHLCQLKAPDDYTDDWKRWSLSRLPMIPPKFGIKLIDNDGYKRQFKVIETLMQQADEIINCGDAGQEGELIQRWVMQKAGAHCPVKRLWISSLTDEAIRDGFAALKPQEEYDNLYYAGLTRAIGDWILGMNATRLYSLKYSEPGKVLSIGRVQTPTLALIVKRQEEIDSFVPQDYWEIKTLYRSTTFNGVELRFDSQEKAEELVNSLKGLPLTIVDVKEKKGREAPPRLFDLTSLQVECNKRWGWSADKTLGLIQSLYEKKVTTYPRVDTTYLSEDIYPKIPTILKQMTPYAALTAPVLGGKIPKSKKVFDNSKVTDHHAIIPTGQSPTVLGGDERPLYHMIALRFIAAFYPDCQFDATTVNAIVDKTPFRTSGKVVTAPGWRAVYAGNDAAKDDDSDDDRLLPTFIVGESGPHEPATVKKTTQPPKYYTEGTLLRAMETAGKTVDDESLRDAMKENGIGRPSTRAGIIETLFKRRYIARERKSIVATQAGIDLINTIQERLIKSAELTGQWENKLRRIERGEYSPREFLDELKEMVSKVVISVLSDNSMHKIAVPDEEVKKTKKTTTKEKSDAPKKPRKPSPKKIEDIPCPLCGQGHLLKGRTAYGCSRYAEGCGLRLTFDTYAADLTPARLNTLIQKQYGAGQ